MNQWRWLLHPNLCRSLFGWFVLAFGVGFLLFLGCDFIDEFEIRLDEGNSYPCVGVSQLTFILRDPRGVEKEFLQQKYAQSSRPTDLFWNGSGKCQMSGGLQLQKIPYGGFKQLLIQGFDSAGQLISKGESPPFLVEPEGAEVKNVIPLELKRNSNMAQGTLILHFRQGLPPGTDEVQVVLLKHVGLNNQPLRERHLVVTINAEAPPGFILLSGLQATRERPIVLHAIQKKRPIKSSQQGTKYSLASSGLSVFLGSSVAQVDVYF